MMNEQQKLLLCKEVATKLGLEPRLLRLLSAVHEAGHAIAAHTLNMKVTSATVASYDTIGNGGDHIYIDFSTYRSKDGDRIIPLPDMLTMRIAGFQASFMWLEGRGIYADQEPHHTALNMLASGDVRWCEQNLGHLKPSTSMNSLLQESIQGAGRILKNRWRTVLDLAYTLADAGLMNEHDLQPHLNADPGARRKAVDSYRAWNQDTAHLWVA